MLEMQNKTELSEAIANTSNKTPIEVLLQVDDDGTVSARNVYKFLELDPKNYSRWCKTNILENEFAEENVDFKAFVINEEWGGQATNDYKLSVPFAKKLCMKQGNEKGEQARNYFIKVEEKLKEVAERAIDIQRLSPEMQMFKHIFDTVAKTQLEQLELQKQLSVTTGKVSAVESTLSVIQDTIIQRDDDWRKSLNKMFNNAVEASKKISLNRLIFLS